MAHGLKRHGPSWWQHYDSRTGPIAHDSRVGVGSFSPYFLFVQSRSPTHRAVSLTIRAGLTLESSLSGEDTQDTWAILNALEVMVKLHYHKLRLPTPKPRQSAQYREHRTSLPMSDLGALALQTMHPQDKFSSIHEFTSKLDGVIFFYFEFTYGFIISLITQKLFIPPQHLTYCRCTYYLNNQEVISGVRV